MRKIIPLLMTAVCTASLCSCSFRTVYSSTDTSQIRFSWWGNDDRNEYTISGIRKFEAQNEQISVTPEYSGFDGFKAKMDMEIYSDTEADVMQLNYDWLYEYSKENSDEFYDLNDLSEYIDLSNFSADELEYGTFDGKLSGIAMSMNAITFYANNSLYSSYGLEIPNTWSDYFDAAEVMKKDEIYPLMLNEKTFWMCCTAYYEQTTGIPVFDEDNNFNYTVDDLEKVLDFYMELIDGKVSKRAEDFNRNDFANCIAGVLPVWISESEYYVNPAKEIGLDIVIGGYPVTNSDYIGFGWYKKPTSLYAVSKDTEEPEAAAKLVNYLVNSEDMYSLQGTEKGVPLSKSALEILTARDELNGIQCDANSKMTSEQDFAPMSPRLENSKLIGYFTDACDTVYYERMSSESAASYYLPLMEKIFA